MKTITEKQLKQKLNKEVGKCPDEYLVGTKYKIRDLVERLRKKFIVKGVK